MKPALPLACLALLAAALGGCGDEKATQQGTAAGEILPGSASDAMLPYDTVRSQPPLAPPPTESAKAGVRKSGGDGDKSGTANSEAAAKESPSASAPAAPEPAAP